MIIELKHETVCGGYKGTRVRVVFNPQTEFWYVYDINEEVSNPIFQTKRLALNFAAVYGELKPKFAPNGSPSFVGTIAAYALDTTTAQALKCHPYAPAKTYIDAEELTEEFQFAKHMLLDGPAMFVSDTF